MSKAFQLGGKALIDAGETDRAAEILTRGYRVAAAKGDFMPRKAMGELLTSIGASVPHVAESRSAPASGGTDFVCGRTGKPGSRLARPPFKGPVGEWIVANISQQTWDDWVRQGTKVINELRLDLSRDEDAATYDRHMREYLGIDEASGVASRS
jgi:Fe-S cluster biosynthesis and repair protein YggX